MKIFSLAKKRFQGALEGSFKGEDLHLAAVVADFNESVTENLLKGCLAVWREHGVDTRHVQVVRVPGAFELPLAAQVLARSGKFQGVAALGCILRGETPHDRYLAQETARGLGQVALETSVPVAFGVLTPLTLAQAKARSGPDKNNKGREAGLAVLQMANLLQILK